MEELTGCRIDHKVLVSDNKPEELSWKNSPAVGLTTRFSLAISNKPGEPSRKNSPAVGLNHEVLVSDR
jgi:hypothetical protein